MHSIQKTLLKLTLFFSWFISFSAYNFNSLNWSLQWSWVFGMLFCISYYPKIITTPHKLWNENTKSFFNTIILLLLIIVLSLFSWSMGFLGVIEYKEPEMIKRSIFHTIYIAYYLLLSIAAFHFIKSDQKKLQNILQLFFHLSFYFYINLGNLSIFNNFRYF